MKKVEVLIQFSGLNEEQLEHLFKDEKELGKAGVSFDTGYGCGCRDWEFDWSLKGAEVFYKRDFIPKVGKNNKTKTMNDIQEPIIPEVNIPEVEKTEEEEKQEVAEKTSEAKDEEEDLNVPPEEPVKEEE